MKYVQVVVPTEIWANFKFIAAKEDMTAREKLLQLITDEVKNHVEMQVVLIEETVKTT
jgi:hypothetical protein